MNLYCVRLFCEEIKWIDAPALICDRIIVDSRRYRWYRCYDDVY